MSKKENKIDNEEIIKKATQPLNIQVYKSINLPEETHKSEEDSSNEDNMVIDIKEDTDETSLVERQKRKPSSSSLDSTRGEMNSVDKTYDQTPKRKLSGAEIQARRERANQRQKNKRFLFNCESSSGSSSDASQKPIRINLEDDQEFECVDATDSEADFNPSRVKWLSRPSTGGIYQLHNIEVSETSQSSGSSESLFSDEPIPSTNRNIAVLNIQIQSAGPALPQPGVIPPPAKGRSTTVYDVFDLLNEEFFEIRPNGQVSAPDRLECLRIIPDHTMWTTRKWMCIPKFARKRRRSI